MYNPTLVYPSGRQGEKSKNDDSMRSTTQVYASVGISTGDPFSLPPFPSIQLASSPYATTPHIRLPPYESWSSSFGPTKRPWTSLFVARNVAMQYSYVHIVTVAAGTARIMFVPIPA